MLLPFLLTLILTMSTPLTQQALEAAAKLGKEPTKVEKVEEAPKKPSRLFPKVGLPAYLAGSAADLYSTYEALDRPGTKEANPLFSKMSRGQIITTNAAISGLLAFAMDRLSRKSPGLDKAATAIGVGGGIGRSAIAYRNSQQGKKND